MSRFRFPRVLLTLALFGWLAQFCLPLAHATAMAEGGFGAAAWCGKNSPALQAKLGKLPAEIREILKGSLGHGEHAGDACAALCITPHGGAVPVLPPTVALPAVGLEVRVAATALDPLLAPRANTPPARGPPALT